MKDPVTVSNGKQKQDIVIADSTGHTTLTLLEEDIGMIVESKSYQLNRVQINHYLGKIELNFPCFGVSAQEIDDLLHVPMLDNNDDTTYLHTVTIIAVTKPETTFVCINCRKALPCDPNNTITHCQQCGTKQKKTQQQNISQTHSSGNQYTLKAYNEMLTNMVPNCSNITQELLLDAPSFNITFDKFNIVTNVTRQ